MATYTGNCGGYTIILNVTETNGSANVGSNTSKVSWSLQFRSGASYCQWNPGPGDFTVTINGSAVWSAQNPSLWFTAMNQTITLASGTTGAITHNSDGKKTVSCKATYTQNSTASYLPSSGSCSGNLTLTTIPRASSFSSISGNVIGGSQTINIDRKSSSFTHSLWYKVGSGSWISIGTGIATSKTWTLPTSLNNQIPSATSLTLTYLLRTYNGSTQIGGDVTYNFNVNYSGEKPTAGTTTITYSNLFNNKFIANYSSATISYSGYAGVYGSTIKSAQVIFNGSWKGATSYNTGLLTAGTHTFQGVATDTRNNSSYTTQQSFTCYQINNPTISINAYRSDADGNADPSGTYITIIPTYSAHDPVGGNSIESSSFTCTTLMTTGTEIASGDKKIISGAEKDGQYSITGIVTDKLGKQSITSVDINTAFAIIDVRSDQKGVAFGKYSTGEDKFEVAWNTYFDKAIYPGAVNFGYKSICEHNEDTIRITSNTFIGNTFVGGGDVEYIGMYSRDLATRYGWFGRSQSTNTSFYFMGEDNITQFYFNKNIVAPNFTDSGWVNCTLSSNFSRYNTTEYAPLQVRKIGNIVHMRGTLRNNVELTGGDVNIYVGTVPSGYRPAYRETVVSQGSGTNRFVFLIFPDGTIKMDRYSNNTTINKVPANHWLHFYATWFLG